MAEEAAAAMPPARCALSYWSLVEDQLAQQPETIQEFRRVLNDFRAKKVDIDQVISRVKIIFCDHPVLLRDFHYFLPQEHHKHTSEPKTVETPSPTASSTLSTLGEDVDPADEVVAALSVVSVGDDSGEADSSKVNLMSPIV